jgi:NAD(P)-dependent dehydrogenase (short-subunit alcohol dehydrogenase family)
MSELADVVVVVTGAAQGVGQCIAGTLARAGARVLAADIQEAKVSMVARDLEEQGGDVRATYVDIADPESARRMIRTALRLFGRVDGLVNNAAIDAPPGLAWELDEAHWRRLIDVDLSGPWWCISAVLPHMMERQKGKIVTISSISARLGGARYSVAYAAAKAGLIGLTVGLAVQLEQFGIRVNAIAPGGIGSTGTPLTDAERSESLTRYPLGFGGPQPTADAVRYLLGGSGDFVSGAVMNVSGGRVRGV